MDTYFDNNMGLEKINEIKKLCKLLYSGQIDEAAFLMALAWVNHHMV